MVDLEADVNKAAGIVARSWPASIEAADIGQEIWLRLVESPDTHRRLALAEERVSALVHIGHQVAAELRSAHEVATGQYRYGTREVRGLLDSGALTDRQGLAQVERFDLSGGLELMAERHEEYHSVLWDYYVHGVAPEHRMKITRAVDALTECMNQIHLSSRYTDHQGPGARRATSNAAAQARTSRSYNGDGDDGRY
ncbi:hypothetical protein [Saccharothrix sp. HUAS TT1]|uniref:hypothetical protein n=1 Tax=unclassified Saccharothrix TaxID=2593673 RepID=UPI00345BA290